MNFSLSPWTSGMASSSACHEMISIGCEWCATSPRRENERLSPRVIADVLAFWKCRDIRSRSPLRPPLLSLVSCLTASGLMKCPCWRAGMSSSTGAFQLPPTHFLNLCLAAWLSPGDASPLANVFDWSACEELVLSSGCVFCYCDSLLNHCTPQSNTCKR